MVQVNSRATLPASVKLLYALFFLTFLLCPFYYQDNLGGEGLGIPFNSVLWIGAGLIIVTGIYQVLATGVWLRPRYAKLVLLFPLGVIFSGFLAGLERPGEWLVRIGAIIGGLLFWFALLQFRLSPRDRDNLLYLLLASLLIHAVIALLQIAPINPLAGWIPISNEQHLIGMFQQANLQASMMATASLLSIYMVTLPGFSGQRWPMKTLILIVLFLGVTEVVGSGSRVGVLGLSVGLVALITSRWKFLKRRFGWFLLLIGVSVSGGYAGLEISDGALRAYSKVERIAEGMSDTSSASDAASGDIRFDIYRVSWEVFKDSPLVGHGVGSFQSVFQDKRIDYEAEHGVTPLARAPRFSHPHNEFLYWLNEGGVIAVFAIISAISAVFLQLVRMGWRRGGAFAALLLPIGLHTQTELPFYISSLHLLVLLLLLSFLFYAGAQERHIGISYSAKRALLPATFVFVPILAVFLSHSLLAQTGIMQFVKGRSTQSFHLRYALKNLYFRDLGEFFTMRALMYSGIQQGSTENLLLFINWAESFLEQIPDIQVFQDLAIAHQQLGNTESALEVIERAHAIYPAQQQVAELRERILRGERLVGPSAATLSSPSEE